MTGRYPGATLSRRERRNYGLTAVAGWGVSPGV